MAKRNSTNPLDKNTVEKLKLVEELLTQVDVNYRNKLIDKMIRQVERDIDKDKLIKLVAERIQLNKIDDTVRSIDEETRRIIQKEENIKDYIKDLYIYVQDPMVAERDKALGIHPVFLPREPGLRDGPTSARLVVFDFDVNKGEVHSPAVWNKSKKRFEISAGKALTENCSDTFKFHQVNTWAIVQYLLTFFESPEVFGRLIPWGFDGNRLILVPHAGFTPNAFYDRVSKSLQFYYLGAPDHPIYNCLSFDVVAHETGHALLDGIRPLYYDFTSLQTAAFHEFFADLTAMMGCLRNNVVRRKEAKDTQGDLKIDHVIRNLAEQFGDAVYHTAGLRDLAAKKKMSDIEHESIPHTCSLVLTGAIFELLQKIIDNYTNDTPELKLWYGTTRILRLAFAPVDFLPPMDVQFIDYAQAVLRCYQIDPSEKETGHIERYTFYENLIKDVFAQRGLDLSTLPQCPAIKFNGAKYDRFLSRNSMYHWIHVHRDELHIPQKRDFQVLDAYQNIKYDRSHQLLPPQYVIQYLWNEDVPLDEDRFGLLKGKTTELLCGGTLVFNAGGELLSWMHKAGCEFPGDKNQGEKRKLALLDHIAAQVAAGRVGLQEDDEVQVTGSWTPSVVTAMRNHVMHLEISRPQLKTLDNTADDEIQNYILNSRFYR